ncbi:MAG: hypothetical protein JWP97_6266 [Labilithrix sp.]|nr:hypothetical protein [Labilithrix sp.]
METMKDITERFRFIDDVLVYVDSPVEGFVVHVSSGDRYAFRTLEIVEKSVWHWVLLPTDPLQLAVADVFTSARKNPPYQWVSIIEDRRDGVRRLQMVAMNGEITRPPI